MTRATSMTLLQVGMLLIAAISLRELVGPGPRATDDRVVWLGELIVAVALIAIAEIRKRGGNNAA